MIDLRTQARLTPTLPVSRSELLPLLEAILNALELQDHDLVVDCVDDAAMVRLNMTFMGCVGPTNILSFPAAPGPGEPFLGELALSLETLSREIILYGQPPVEHLVRLVTHGILHLAGYEHGEAMTRLTERIVAQVGCTHSTIDLE